MALTAQMVADDASREVRKYFYDTATDAVRTSSESLFIAWVNMTHQDVLHTSIWQKLVQTSETFLSVPDGSPYVLSANNIRHILTVHDLKNRKTLVPYHDLNYPAATSTPPERGGPPRDKFDQNQQTSSQSPQYYITEGCGVDGLQTWAIHLLPDPQDAAHSGTIRYWYSKTVDAVTALGDTLVVPEDGRDLMVAGVAAKAWAYLRGPESNAAQQAVAKYDSMKKGF